VKKENLLFRTKTMALAGGVSAACLLLGAPSAGATTYNITLGVAANFYSTALDIIAAVNNATPSYAYGFVAKSQVCKDGKLGAAGGGAFKITKAFEYVYDGSSSPNFGHGTTTSQTYGKIVQNALAIEHQQGAATKAVIVDFGSYIVGGGNGQGTVLRTHYCYGLTP
jgi:hypothetical protein